MIMVEVMKFVCDFMGLDVIILLMIEWFFGKGVEVCVVVDILFLFYVEVVMFFDMIQVVSFLIFEDVLYSDGEFFLFLMGICCLVMFLKVVN